MIELTLEVHSRMHVKCLIKRLSILLYSIRVSEQLLALDAIINCTISNQLLLTSLKYKKCEFAAFSIFAKSVCLHHVLVSTWPVGMEPGLFKTLKACHLSGVKPK